MSKNPAVDTAKDNKDPFAVRTNLDGIRYQLRPVAPALMDAVTSRIKLPSPPMWHNPEMDRDEPNTAHPDYLAAIEDTNRQRGTAVYDAMVMFGIRLVDDLPIADEWLQKLAYMEKRKLLDLSEYDLEDPMDLEFLFKRFVLATSDMVDEVGKLSALSAEEVKQAGASFPGNA